MEIEEFVSLVQNHFPGARLIEVIDMKKASDQQKKAYHLFCRQLADHMNAHNIDMKAVFEAKKVSMPMDEELVKRVLWKPIQAAKYDCESINEIPAAGIDFVYEMLIKHLGEHCGMPYIPFPSEEEMAAREANDRQ